MKEKTIEDYPRLNSWIEECTFDGDFVSHPDFVEDAMMELLNEIERLKSCVVDIAEDDPIGEIKSTLKEHGFELVHTGVETNEIRLLYI
jgi:hypothetical protein